VLLGVAAAARAAAPQGVTDTEVVIGTHQDLSGPITFWGVPVRNGMQMATDEINAAGGVHGRKIKLIVEDSGYDPKKAVLATQKMLSRDSIFIMAGAMGTPTVLATMPLVLEKGLPHVFPLTAATQMYEPYDRLKYALFTPYNYAMRVATKWFVETRGKKAVCILHQDDEFGLNVKRGVEDQLRAMKAELVAATTYKRGATDFSSQIAKLRAEKCDLVALGTVIRETIVYLRRHLVLEPWGPEPALAGAMGEGPARPRCPECGAEHEPDDAYCGRCGASLAPRVGAPS